MRFSASSRLPARKLAAVLAPAPLARSPAAPSAAPSPAVAPAPAAPLSAPPVIPRPCKWTPSRSLGGDDGTFFHRMPTVNMTGGGVGHISACRGRRRDMR